MGTVVFNMTMSLDGFVSGVNDNPEQGLGENGDRLFNWYFKGDTEVSISAGVPSLKVPAESAPLIQESLATTGAGVWGRKTFDIAHGWGGKPPSSPAFIVSHSVAKEWVYDGSPFTFVTDGVESAIRQARAAAGAKNVVICTANILQQCLNAGLVDEIHVDLAPVLLGRGVRLFEHLNIQPHDLEILRVIATPLVTHISYRIVR